MVISKTGYGFFRSLAVLLAVFLAMAFGNPAVGASATEPSAGLFSPADSPPVSTINSASVRQDSQSRYVAVDFGALGEAASPAAELRLNLFDGIEYTAVFERTESNDLGSYAWIGRLEGVDLSNAVLVVTNGLLAGKISMPGAQYAVEYAAEGVYRVSRIDQSVFPPELDPIIVDTEAGAADVLPFAADDACTAVRVLVAYTPEARIEAGGTKAMEALIALAITETNDAYANTGITTRLVLAHTMETRPGDATNDEFTTDLVALQNLDDGIFEDVDAARELYLADAVALIVESTASCGLGYVGGAAAWAFSVTARICATGNLTFGHELGHNMLLRHDWYVDDCATDEDCRPSDPSNKGFVNIVDKWRTIMAYNRRCTESDPGFNCERLPFFASPDNTKDGDPMGVDANGPTNCVAGEEDPDPSSCAADNKLAANNVCAAFANHRDGSPPAGKKLTVKSSGAARVKIGSGNGHAGITDYTKTVPGGAAINLVAPLLSGLMEFKNWTGCTSVSGASNSVCSVTVDINRTVTANYVPTCIYTLTQPNGGQAWSRGKQYAVKWSSKGAACAATVKLQLFKGGAFNSTIAASTSNMSFPWTIPAAQAIGMNYKVKVVDNAKPAKYFDFSNNSFTIKSPVTPPTGVNATDGAFEDRVELTWNPVAGAASYRGFRCIGPNSGCVSVGLVAADERSDAIAQADTLKLSDKGGELDKVYHYSVKACAAGACSAFSKSDEGHRAVPAMTNSLLPIRRFVSFDKDGKDDVLLRNQLTGKWQINFIQFLKVLANSGPTALVANLDWQMMGAGDFDGSGHGDVLVRNVKTGSWGIYLMNGRTRTWGLVGKLFSHEDWAFAAVDDFDGDGKDDILLRNLVTGRWYINFMNGRVVRTISGFTPLFTNLDWEMMGTGDFNGSGRGDVLLRHKNTYAWWIFLMNGRNKGGGSTALTKDRKWGIAGIDDFNGDGKDDVLLRHDDTGRWLINFMRFLKVLPNSGGTAIFNNLAWEMMGTGDFNGSGRGDVLLRNKTNGSWWLFLMNGRSKVSGSILITKDSDWKIPYRIEDGD